MGSISEDWEGKDSCGNDNGQGDCKGENEGMKKKKKKKNEEVSGRGEETEQ